MVGAWQTLQGKGRDPVEIVLSDPGHGPPRHMQAADGHRGQVIANDPCALSVDGGGQRIGQRVIWLRLRGEGQHRDAAVQFGRFRQDQDRAALPLTMLTPQQIDQARTWWASLPETEKEIRREHSEKLRRNFGIPLPEGEDGWAAVCYEDENS